MDMDMNMDMDILQLVKYPKKINDNIVKNLSEPINMNLCIQEDMDSLIEKYGEENVANIFYDNEEAH